MNTKKENVITFIKSFNIRDLRKKEKKLKNR